MIRRSLSRWTDGPLTAGVLLTAGCVLAFAPDPYLLMLARSFLWQWALAAAGIALFALVTRRWWSAAGAGAATLLLAFPPCPTVGVPAGGPAGPELVRVAQMNVLQPNDDHDAVIAAAIATDADVISFQEVSPVWAEKLLRGLSDEYPFSHIVPGNTCYGIAMFSRLPFARIGTVHLHRRPMLLAEVETLTGPVRLLSVHATSPGSWAEFRERNAQLDELTSLVNDSPMPVVLFGDLNTVSWDRALRRLCRRTGLREHPDGARATWPSIAGLALIPLDHVLVTPGLAVDTVGIFPIPGSDHRGVTAVIRERT